LLLGNSPQVRCNAWKTNRYQLKKGCRRCETEVGAAEALDRLASQGPSGGDQISIAIGLQRSSSERHSIIGVEKSVGKLNANSW